jgi:MoxR-like ATPase
MSEHSHPEEGSGNERPGNEWSGSEQPAQSGPQPGAPSAEQLGNELSGNEQPASSPSETSEPAPSPEANNGLTGHVPAADLERFQHALDALRDRIGGIVLGQEDATDALICGLLSGGHVLLEGVPGIAKTLLAKLLARCLKLDYARIQFTPDLMPSDVVGTSVFNMEARRFEFQKGPVFAQVVLIDEINRAPAKTQAALFEVMEERQITYDGIRYAMKAPFFVVATQNPIEQEGTYRLPEAQLDRFLFRIKMHYPGLADEEALLRRFKGNFGAQDPDRVEPVLDGETLLACQALVEKVHATDALCSYIAAIVHATRDHGSLYLGASPRASLGILRSAKALALMEGRDYVLPEDVQAVALSVLNHRILLTSERELEGLEPETVIKDILSGIELPR